MAPVAIELERVTKRYRAGRSRTLVDLVGSNLDRIRGRSREVHSVSRGRIDSTIWALRDASFAVPQGAGLGVIGRNGAGKTTLLRTLNGLVPPASGTIEYEGQNIAGMPAPDIARLGVGYVPQGRQLFAGMTVAENLALGRLARATDGKDAIVWSEEQILEYFPRLKERLHVAADFLSGGEQQMLAVARALSGNVKLLLLDEPFEGLAPNIVKELFRVFDALRGRASIIIVEHNLDLVLALADRVFALDRGAVIHQGPARPLLTDLAYRKQILWV
jgi:ABC-type branched-subunit amino acid transport system ATPase component